MFSLSIGEGVDACTPESTPVCAQLLYFWDIEQSLQLRQGLV